jgi:predicted DNA-binding transcriptional regulator AlpA
MQFRGLAEATETTKLHRTTCWSLYKRSEFPVPVLRIGGSLRIVRAHLEMYLSNGVPVEPGTRIDALATASCASGALRRRLLNRTFR